MLPTRRHQHGFTLIELLIVIGVIAVLAGVVGIGLSRGGEGATLATGRTLLIAQVDAARSRAVLNGEGAAVAITADETSPSTHLREVCVVVPDGAGWRQATEPERLPGDTVVRLTRSSLLSGPSGAGSFSGSDTVSCYMIPFDGRGRLVTSPGGQIWLGTLAGAADPDAVEIGLVISRYGVLSEVEDSL